MKRLGLIKFWGIPIGVDQYERIEEFLGPSKDEIESEEKDYESVSFKRGYYNFTEFGQNFINSCLPDKD